MLSQCKVYVQVGVSYLAPEACFAVQEYYGQSDGISAQHSHLTKVTFCIV